MNLPSTQVWIPPTEDSTLHQLMAVWVPPNQNQIETMESYLQLLAMRLSEMIQQLERTEAVLMIQRSLNRAGIHQIDTPTLSDPPQQWAEVLTLYNPVFQEALMFLDPNDRPAEQNLLEFPLLPTELTIDLQQRIQETTLEEWLALMVSACNP